VLFADMVDSTARADGADPEDVRASLVAFHALLREALERHGATVEKFIGDAVVAVFGAPVTREDDAERAVRAALEIRDAVARGSDVGVRVGVATGEALVDLRAEPAAGQNVAAGDVLNVGSRLASAATRGAIFVDVRTYAATSDAIDYRALDPLTLKGKAEPVAAWEALASRAAERRETAFVGRRRELETLRTVLADAVAGAPQLVTMVGVPGIGKSRLVDELYETSPERARWLQGRSLPYGTDTPFWALTEIVRAHAGILRTDGPQEAEARLRASFPTTLAGDEAAWVESHVRALVGLAAADPGRSDERFAAWRRLFEALADEVPLVLVFEDLHWADEALLAFIDSMVAWAATRRLLVLCTARPELLERHPGWGRSFPDAVTIHLEPLAPDETVAVLEATAGRGLAEHVEADVLARVEGNPLYAQEYARMIAERGVGERARALPLPDSVQAVIAARMDALPPREKAVVHDAAVVGRTCWTGALAALSGEPRFALDGSLQALERKEFLRREPASSVPSETAYSFHHVLVRDVAYGQIPRVRRSEKHRRTAEWLETLRSSREDLAELIAHHYASALQLARETGVEADGLAERARRALREAGERASRLNATAAAAGFFRSSLELTPADDPDRPRLQLAYGIALARSEHAGNDILEEARAGLVAVGDVERAAAADAELSDLLLIQGSHEGTFEVLDRARQLLAAAPPSPAKATILSKLAGRLMFVDHPTEATRVGLEALEMAEELDLPLIRADVLATVGFARAALGDADGVEDLERSIAIALEENSPQALRGYINLGTVLANFGDLRAAFDHYRKGLALARRFGDLRGIMWFAAEGIYESYWTGRWDEACATIERLLADPRALHQTRFDAQLVRGWIRLARGDVDGAVADADAVLEAGRGGESQFLFPALAFRARALVATGAGTAVDCVDEMIERVAAAATSYTSFWVTDLAVAACSVGRSRELLGALPEDGPTKWTRAARAYAEGDFAEAARLYDEIGSTPDAAYARLRAAGDGTAVDFFRSVGANAVLADAKV
jgi:class 3 adenylate cyclase/tetratricopeptide (TPR) repeat protein